MQSKTTTHTTADVVIDPSKLVAKRIEDFIARGDNCCCFVSIAHLVNKVAVVTGITRAVGTTAAACIKVSFNSSSWAFVAGAVAS